MEWINSKQTFPISRVYSRPICPVSCDPEQPSVDFLPRKVSLTFRQKCWQASRIYTKRIGIICNITLIRFGRVRRKDIRNISKREAMAVRLFPCDYSERKSYTVDNGLWVWSSEVLKVTQTTKWELLALSEMASTELVLLIDWHVSYMYFNHFSSLLQSDQSLTCH